MSQQYVPHSAHPLREIVHSTLARNPYLVGRNVHAQLLRDEVVLTGVVGSYYQKQMAQESIRAIDGVNSVRNELEVISR